jgi:hypothetical protein
MVGDVLVITGIGGSTMHEALKSWTRDREATRMNNVDCEGA